MLVDDSNKYLFLINFLLMCDLLLQFQVFSWLKLHSCPILVVIRFICHSVQSAKCAYVCKLVHHLGT